MRESDDDGFDSLDILQHEGLLQWGDDGEVIFLAKEIRVREG